MLDPAGVYCRNAMVSECLWIYQLSQHQMLAEGWLCISNIPVPIIDSPQPLGKILASWVLTFTVL